MDEWLKRLLALLIALPFVGAFGSIVYYVGKHRAQLLQDGQVVIVEQGKMFGCPQECWLLTATGVLYAIGLLLVLIAVCFLSAKIFRDFPLKLWLLIILFGWIATNFAAVVSFSVHKDDYIYIGNNNIAQKFGKWEWQARYSEIRSIKRKGKVFIVYFKGSKIIRITDSRLGRLYDNEKLAEELRNLSNRKEP